MKNELVSLRDKFLLRKRPAIKTINDELKNICEIEYSRHRGKRNFIINIIAALAACCIFPKKSVIKFEKGDANQSAPLF